MGKTLYVFSSASLKRKDNTLMLQTKNSGASYIPVETVDEILIMGEAEINKSLIELLSEKGIVLHFFDHFGKYTGTYSPPENKNSGQVFLSQASHWLNERKRSELAAAFVVGAIGNMINLIRYYQRLSENINAGEIIDYLKFCLAQAPDTSDIPSLMDIEGTARNAYYKTEKAILMGEAVNLALDMLERRINDYRKLGVPYYHPWLVLMAGGEPNGIASEWNKLVVFPLGIGRNADLKALEQFSPQIMPLTLAGLNVSGFFEWLSRSVDRTSVSMPGSSVPLPALNGEWAILPK